MTGEVTEAAWGPGPGPTARWRRQVLAAPGLVVLGLFLLIGTAVLDDRHGRRADALCHHLPVPWTLFALAWPALLCGLAGPVLCGLLFRAAARTGHRGSASWQGTLALCICVCGTLPLLFELVALYGVHAESTAPSWHCTPAP
ncbi:hypothetical protein OG552_13570 [Streptomyces sp. NBC_01476]|uniref:hypothetical protein n=1 Tax=Streptomyces sp. NBC_01476 TaxID=2903881 RepID=UPI002E355879|nr:hypothetical protein [Streptomyces sp. NBC_01476]